METKNTQRSKKPLLITIACLVAAAIIFGIVLMLTQCNGGTQTVNSGALSKQLASEGTLTITLEEDVVLDTPLVVNGNKTILGSGKILLKTEQAGAWPESDKPAWGMGCASVEAADASAMSAALQVSGGASLTLGGSVTVDAEGNANGILLSENAELKLTENAAVKNGRYANLVIVKGAKASVAGGEVADGSVFNILNHGALDVTGGRISGARAGANIYTDGTASQSGGAVSLSGLHNVYVAGGSFTMTGGTNESAAKDGIVVEEGAKADITGGDIGSCIHGICNNGETNTGKLTLAECGIMNYETGVLNIKGTTVDTSEVYCLANSGGKVTAEDFTAKKCDTVAVYNFSGDIVLKNLTVTGGRDGNISNAGGNMTVDGAVLDNCRDKSVVVGNGKAVLNNVKINGTSKEKYGVYVFGGELYLNDSSIANISSTAVKADPGSYVELNNVTIKDITQNGFQTDGGRVVINNVTLENAGSHGIYNNGGEVIVNKMQADGIKKNAIQHKSGTTTVTGITAKTMGNHGAYVEAGTLTVKDSSFENMAANGFYIVKGENKLILEGVTITDAVQQGINNDSVVELKNVTISATGKNGIYNKVGSSMTIDGLKVTNVGEHGINNKAKMTAKNVTVSGTGSGSNGIQNNGTLTLSDANISDSKNHGIYNSSKLTATNVTVKNTDDNGIYNDGGELDITTLAVENAKGQGVNNNATLTLKDVTIKTTGKNGIYNAKGAAKIENLVVSGTTEHGVNNAAVMELTDVDISGSGEGKNGLQNSGELTVSQLKIADSKKHGIYNSGKLTASDVTIANVGDNGVYNNSGDAVFKNLRVDNTKGHGVNNDAKIKLENATIVGTGVDMNGVQNSGELTISQLQIVDSKKHGIYNSGKLTASDVTIANVGDNGVYNNSGDAVFKNLRVDNTKGHGVNNDAKIKLENATIVGTGVDMNGVQNSGELTISQLQIVDSKKHGIYNSGSITGEKLAVQNSGDNGIYNDGGKVTALKDVVIDGAVNQGINNTGAFGAENVSISGTGKNGVLNKVGSLALKSLNIADPGEHGVSNENGGTVILVDAVIVGSAAGKNCLQNQAIMALENVEVFDSKNHGIYNAGTLTAKGTLVVSHAAVNGIYNYLGTADLEQIDVRAAGEHGINNAAKLTVGKVIIGNATQNGIQNSGEMNLTGEAEIMNSGKHGIYNGGTFYGKGITVCDAGDLLLSNSGDMIIDGLTLTGSAHKAIYNAGYAEIYNAVVDGKNVRNPSSKEVDDGEGGKKTVAVYEAEYLIDNNGGILDLEDTLISNAFGTAIHNRGNAHTSVTRVVIDTVGNYGIFVAGDSSLSGDTLYICKVSKNTEVSGAEGVALKIQGKVTMLDHVTIDDVQNNNAVILDATTATYSGLGLKITNVPNGCAVYNKGTMFITNFETENVKDGMVSRYEGNATMSGTVTIKNTLRNPITTYGPESGNYKNSVSLSAKAELTIDGCASHAINNKGSFLAAADSKITIKNVVGTNINAINNNGGTVKLGDVEIDGLFVTISWNKGENKNNTNSGTAIMNSGPMTIDGHVVIKNVFYLAVDADGNPNGKDDNTNGAGVVVHKSGSAINGKGSITVIGNQTAPAGYEGYEGLHNGIFIDGRTIDIDGDVTVSNAKNQGIYVANANAKVECGNITVNNAGANGVYVNNANGALNVADNVQISNIGQNGLVNVGKMQIGGNVSIQNVNGGHNGLRNDGSGNLTIEGNLTIDGISGTTTGTGRGNALASNGRITVKGDLTISGVTASGDADNSSNNAIYGKGVITVGGNVKVTDKVAAGHGVFLDQGKLLVTGDIEINGTGSGKQGIYLANSTESKAATVTGRNVTVKKAGGNGIYNRGAYSVITVTGDIVVSGSAGGHGLSTEGTITAANVTISDTTKSDMNGIEAKSGSKMTVTGAITITNSGKRGLNNAGQVKAASLTIDGFGENGIQNAGTLEISGAITISNGIGNGHGVYNSKTFTAGSLSISNVKRNGINNAGNMTVIGEVSVKNAVQGGIGSNKNFTAGSVSIDTVTAGPGINNSGTFTVAGLTAVQNITGTDVSAIQNKGTMTLNDVLVDAVKVNVGTETVEGQTKDKTNVGNAINNEKTLTINGTATITNVFTDKKNNSLGAGLNLLGGATLNGSGSLVITGSASTDSAYPYGINNGIFMDASEGAISLVLTGDITIKDVTNVGIYLANSAEDKIATLSAGNITVSNTGSNGIYNRGAYSTVTVTGAITVDRAEGHGLNNDGAVTAGAITISNTTKNGINSTGTITVTTGDVTVNNAGDNGVASNGVFSAPNSNIIVDTVKNQGVAIKADMSVKGISVTRSSGHGVAVNQKNVKLVVTETIRVDGFTKRGISNTQSGGYIKAKNIVVKNGTSANIDAGIKNGNASAKIEVTENMTVSNIGGTAASEMGNGITNTGTITVGGMLTVTDVTTTGATNDKANCGIWNKGGTITAGTIAVDRVATKAGIYINGGTVTADTVKVQNITKYVGIFMDSGATLEATDVLVENVLANQAIQANHANTITVTNLVILNCAKNGLRLYNNNANPTVNIQTVVAYGCAEWGIAAAKNITSTDANIGAAYCENCTSGAVHSRVSGCVVQIQTTIPAAVREALTQKGITIPTSN